MNLEIQRSQYKGQRSQYINVRKPFKGGNYMRKYGIQFVIRAGNDGARMVYIRHPFQTFDTTATSNLKS